MTNIDLYEIAVKFDKWLEETSEELEIDKDNLQSIIRDLLIG